MRTSPFPEVSVTEHTKVSNDKVRKALSAEGDLGTAERHVMHYLVKPDDASFMPSQMADLLRPLGFEIDLARYDRGVIAEEHREVASADFDALTQNLFNLARQYGWRYDGFECALMQPSAAPSKVRRWGPLSLLRWFGRAKRA